MGAGLLEAGHAVPETPRVAGARQAVSVRSHFDTDSRPTLRHALDGKVALVIAAGMQPVALFSLMRQALLPATCLLVIGYFGVHAIFGASGYLALGDIRREHAQLAETRAALEARRDLLQRDLRLLDPRGVDPDYADELVRRHLGVVRPDEVIVPLGPPGRQ